MDRANVEDLVATMQDSTDDNDAGRISSSCFQNSAAQDLPLDDLRNSLSCLAGKDERAKDFLSSLVYAGSKGRQQQGLGSVSVGSNSGTARRTFFTSYKKGQKEEKAAVGKQRQQSPLSSWIGKQLLGQNISKRHLEKDGKLTMMEGYPHGLLAIPSDGYA
jgi:hypothetical protein